MTVFEGPEGVEVFRVTALRSSLLLLKAGIKPGRGWTKTKGLAEASKITGATYSARKAEDFDRARADLRTWLDANAPGAVAAGKIR